MFLHASLLTHPSNHWGVMISIGTCGFQIDAGTAAGANYFPTVAQPDGSLTVGQSTNILTMAFVGVTVQKNSGAGTLGGQVQIVGELLEALP